MRTLSLLIAGCLSLLCPSLAGAACTDGDARLEAGDFEGAIRAYEAAQARPECASEVAHLRINEGFARESFARKTGRPADACEALYAWRRALPGASKRVATAIESSIEAMTAACVPPGRVVIRCEPAGATVRIEALGEPRPCPATFERIAPGRYRGVAVAAGVETPFEVEATAGQTARITVRLGQTPVVASPAPSSAPSSVSTQASLDDRLPMPSPAPGLSTRAEDIDPTEPVELTAFAWTATALAVVAAGTLTYAIVRQGMLEDDASRLSNQADEFDSGAADYSERIAHYNQRYDEIEAEHATLGDVTLGASIAAGVFAAAAVTLFALDTAPAPDGIGTVRIGPATLSVAF